MARHFLVAQLRFLATTLALVGLVICLGATASFGQEPRGETPPPQPKTTVDTAIPIEQLRVLARPLTREELEVEADAWFELLRKKAGQISAAQLGVKKTNDALAADDEDAAKQAIDEASRVMDKAEAESEQAEREMAEGAQESLGLDGPTHADDEPESQRSDQADRGEGSGTHPATDAAAIKKDDLLADITTLQDERAALADRLEVVLASLERKSLDDADEKVAEYRKYVLAVSGIELDAKDASATWAAITGWLKSREGGQRWLWNLGKFLLVLMASYLVAGVVASLMRWLLERRINMSRLAENLIARTIKNIVMLIGLAIALTALEIDITPIIAAIGAAGFIIGFALQGTLSNFASGLMILINRPFDVGDVVSAGGVTGLVQQMNLVSTTFHTFDNQTIHVPNNEIWGNVITNITANDKRRVDLEFGIGYDDDFEHAEEIIHQVVQEHELVLDEPEPVVVTHELADSSVNIVCRPWAKTSDWWKVKTDITRSVKRRFDQEGISIPYPQTDIHVYQHQLASAQSGSQT
ncbi:mechanosensitive ion channel family protein [Botrimarina mediterranea]|uniref:Small-conductance mechanosensitive channel n=1 Tax=Botrimarina mediterranea TaxID=2528022 RepID=A0A518K8I1_9BACT|nr:mechanosensitive ion channel family protein [Botrimarina mediterranea]QDV74108.1 Small-conductance mechanosensitive channel [Botrimarina mediterranea]QDV78738.1 Small-conductance mechanosensitive channel [Planctomycetes bacterium K2D]